MNKGDYRYNYRESARGRKKPADEIVYLEGIFEPLVDPGIWEKVNKIMDINRDQRNIGGDVYKRQLLTFFLSCSDNLRRVFVFCRCQTTAYPATVKY